MYEKQGDQSDLGRSLIIGVSNADNSNQLQDLLQGFKLADKSQFVIDAVELILEKYETQVFNLGYHHVMITSPKEKPLTSQVYDKIGLTILDLYMMKNRNQVHAQKFIDKASESKEKLSQVIDHFYKSAIKHQEDNKQSEGFNSCLMNQHRYNKTCIIF